MTAQEILEGITRHRANPVQFNQPSGHVLPGSVERKIEEVEWALQALAEWACQLEATYKADMLARMMAEK